MRRRRVTDGKISTGGGTYAAWSADGKELYYLDPSGAMMAASISVIGNKLNPGTPRMLFRTRISRAAVTCSRAGSTTSRPTADS